MQRLLRETFVLIGAPVAIAVAVLLVGTAIAQTPTKAEPPELWPVSECHTTTVAGLAGSGASGSALLCTAEDAVRPAAYLAGLTPGGTYGVWLLASDRLADCPAGRCVVDEAAGTPGYPRIFGRLGEVSAGEDGAAHFSGHVDGWSAGGASAVALLVTNQNLGSTAPWKIGRGSDDIGRVIAVAVFRLP